jgi:hypothetical protein
MPGHCRRLSLAILVPLILGSISVAADSRYFAIHVIDDATGRGVPLVELKTDANVSYYTDSAGYAAIDDPVLMGRKAYFFIRSDGYEYPADGFGYRGQTLDVEADREATLKIHRLNIAERLYRLTGEGIYRDSVMLGRPVPIREPLLNAQVTGQDSTQAVVYGGVVHWFWGDTMRPSFPLGHFGTSGATSELPGRGGLDPSIGVDLKYYTDADGFARPTLDEPDGTMRWLDALLVVHDDDGREKMVGVETDHKSLSQVVGRKLVVWNDRRNAFDVLANIPSETRALPVGHPVWATSDGVDYFYFGFVFPNQRVKADLRSVADFASYESYTCLAPGTSFSGERSQIQQNADGSANWSWKKNAEPLSPGQIMELFKLGKLKTTELRYLPTDADGGKPVVLQGGSATYNAYRRKWVEIAVQEHGDSSFLGEVWYSEADHPEGPWLRAKKIVTHDRYSFYNPVQHPFFEQEGGKLMYFDGTYATTFSRDGDPTPRYDYNLIMYRLDLSDPRLH